MKEKDDKSTQEIARVRKLERVRNYSRRPEIILTDEKGNEKYTNTVKEIIDKKKIDKLRKKEHWYKKKKKMDEG